MNSVGARVAMVSRQWLDLTNSIISDQNQSKEIRGRKLRQGCAVVLDVGKSLAKLTMWSSDRRLVDRRTRPNSRSLAVGYPSLDVHGITTWLEESLNSFARQRDITTIIPVGHGAAACIVDQDGLCLAPVDYEGELPADLTMRYLQMRDPFSLTGSPSLPAGLNLGAQLFWLETIAPDEARRGLIVTWPQYWAWLLCGVAATEVTSLGCHTDLWMPGKGRPSPMAVSRGWADRFAPLRGAGDVLGTVTKEWQERCGLPKDCAVLCGVHDSNAALLAARLYPEVADRECTVLSTGTWFIAMRSVASDAKVDLALLPESRDCLVNVDAFGAPVPSSRFMGGREVELLEAANGSPIDPSAHEDVLLQRAARMVDAGVFALPTFQNGVGPFPEKVGRWVGDGAGRPDDQLSRRAVASLYLALMANASFDLIGSTENFVIEGRFAGDSAFTRALAALRPRQSVYLSQVQDNVPFGALRLIDASLPPQAELVRVEPLDVDLTNYADRWRSLAEVGERGTPRTHENTKRRKLS